MSQKRYVLNGPGDYSKEPSKLAQKGLVFFATRVNRLEVDPRAVDVLFLICPKLNKCSTYS